MVEGGHESYTPGAPPSAPPLDVGCCGLELTMRGTTAKQRCDVSPLNSQALIGRHRVGVNFGQSQ